MNITNPQHPHHDVYAEWLKQAAADPTNLPVIQWKHPAEDWRAVIFGESGLPNTMWSERYAYRVKPKTITRPAVEVPAPLTVEPPTGDKVFLTAPDRVYESRWVSATMKGFFHAGLCYATWEEAEACRKAMYPGVV